MTSEHPIVRDKPLDTELLAVTSFDYAALDSETRIVVQHTREIRDRVKVVGDAMIAIGQRLIEVKGKLNHGQFGVWLRTEFEWSQDTAGSFMNVARLAAENPRFSEHAAQFGRSALTLLAAPSTPPAAREELLDRAAQGEIVSHQEAREVVQHHRAVEKARPVLTLVPAAPPAAPAAAPAALETEPEASGPHVEAMRRRFNALGWDQLYPNDQGWRATTRGRTKQFTAWGQVEPFVAELERAAAHDAEHWIELSLGGPTPRRARVLERTGNLVIHEAVDHLGGFVVTHAPSFRLIIRCVSIEGAHTALQRLAVLDWNFTSTTVPPSLKDAVLQVINALIAEGIGTQGKVDQSTQPAPAPAVAPAVTDPVATVETTSRSVSPPLPPELPANWQLEPPWTTSGLWSARHVSLPVSTHSYETPEEAIDAAEERQWQIEAVEADDYTISGEVDALVAAKDGITIGPARNLPALMNAILEHGPIPCTTPAPPITILRPAQPAPVASPSTQTRHAPIVPTVLRFNDQRNQWKLPAPQRIAVQYGTPMTIRASTSVQTDVGLKQTFQQAHVWGVPDDAAWEQVQDVHTKLQQAFDALADELRGLGQYTKQLEAAGGLKNAPNPLSPVVIVCDDPDTYHSMYLHQLAAVPRVRTEAIKQHTRLMLVYAKYEGAGNKFHQNNCFVCPTDEDLERVLAVRQRALDAKAAFDGVLEGLGTYDVALRDGRYSAPAQRAAAPLATPVHVVDWQVVEKAAAQLNQTGREHDEMGTRAAALRVLELLAQPGELVLPPFPAENRAALVAAIGQHLDAIDHLSPDLGRFFRAVGRYVAGVQQQQVSAAPQRAPAGAHRLAVRLADLQHRFDRIDGWIGQLRRMCPTVAAVRGNLDNLQELADDVEQLGEDAPTGQLAQRIASAGDMLELLTLVIEEHGQFPLMIMVLVDELITTDDPFTIKAHVEAAGFEYLAVLQYAYAVIPKRLDYAPRIEWLEMQLNYLEGRLAQRVDVVSQEAGA